jgi:L,D-peptidoglycan transpeptidase YkuD (ErfK/YbiS/YcfS/YnhG family)
LRRAFGKSATLDTHLNYRQVTTRDVWIDEPASPSYNQWLIEDTSPIVSHETLLRSDHQYDAAIVVEYNTDPIVPGMGSAIFMHIWRSPTSSTAGCVAMYAGDLSRFLKWLNPQKKPVVMIR